MSKKEKIKEYFFFRKSRKNSKNIIYSNKCSMILYTLMGNEQIQWILIYFIYLKKTLSLAFSYI